MNELNVEHKIRTAYGKRDTLQQELHLTYGPCSLSDVDSLNDIFIEYKGDNIVAFVEFKNDAETIKPYAHRAMAKAATALNIPFYISVLQRKPIICYYLIPMNEAAKKLHNMETAKFWTEAQYVWLIHKLRGAKPEKAFLDKFCNTLPSPLPPLPNIEK